jgi:hypothetical protein
MQRINQIVHGALKKTNSRGIILSGWGKVKNRSQVTCFILMRFRQGIRGKNGAKYAVELIKGHLPN